MDVLMLLSNPFKPDPRVYEEADTLCSNGYKVTVLAWDRENRFPERERMGCIDVIRVRVSGGYGDARTYLPGLFRYYVHALKKARAMHYDVVHAHDFDTLPLGIFMARIKNARVIYDVHDDYPSMISESVPEPIVKAISIFQNILTKFVDGFIYANEALAKIIGGKGEVVMNCKDPEDYQVDDNMVESLRTRLGVGRYTVVYIGILRQYEFLKTLIEAVRKSGYDLVIGGDGPYREEIMRLIDGDPHIKYIGWVKSKDIPLYTRLARVVVVLNDPSKRYDRISTPVKMFEAMAAGIPVIVSEGGEAAKIVKKCGCGLTVKFGDVNSLADALLQMKEDAIHIELSKNALKAANGQYNRKVNMERLLNYYRSLFPQNLLKHNVK